MINKSALLRASGQCRDPFKEISEGKFWLVIVPLKALRGNLFNRLVQDSGFQKQLCLAFIDECDPIGEQESGFRPSCESIGDLRARLPGSIPWVAVSGSLPREPFDGVMSSLGFHRGRYVRASLPVDNPYVCYVPRFHSYPTSGIAFLDLAWLIPPTATSATDITKTLIFCETFDLGHRVERFLERLLPRSFSRDTIRPHHSLISDRGRLLVMERFREGTTRIIVASDCFTCGSDFTDIRNVVVFGLPSSFSKLVQQIGQAGRDGEQAYAIAYAPPWVEETPRSSEKGTERETAESKMRNEMCPVLRRWFNPTKNSCPRDVLCFQFDEEPTHPRNCCTMHCEDLPNMEPEESQVTAFTPQRTKVPTARPHGTCPPLSEDERLSASRMISTWTRQKWAETYPVNTLRPPGDFLSELDQDRLCENLRAITSIEALSGVLCDWPHLEEYKTELYQLCENALKELDSRKGA